MGGKDPSTKMLPVSLQLCHISSSSTGLSPRADWDKMVDLGIYSPAMPLPWVGNMCCMSAKQSHPWGAACWQLRPTSAFLSCIRVGEAAGKQARILHSPNPDLLRWVLRTLLSQHGLWGPRAAGSSAEVRLQPARLLLKFLKSCKLRTYFSSGNNVGKLERRDSDGVRHLKPLLVCGVTWPPGPPWEETEAVTMVLIKFMPGKNSKWAILVIQDTSAVALWHGPKKAYMHSPGVLACLNRVFCRCWHKFPSWDLFSFTWSYKGPCGW